MGTARPPSGSGGSGAADGTGATGGTRAREGTEGTGNVFHPGRSRQEVWDEALEALVSLLRDARGPAGESWRIMREHLLMAQAAVLTGMLEVVERQIRQIDHGSRSGARGGAGGDGRAGNGTRRPLRPRRPQRPRRPGASARTEKETQAPAPPRAAPGPRVEKLNIT